MKQWVLLAVILSAGVVSAHTITINYAVRIGNNSDITIRANDTDYNTTAKILDLSNISKKYISLNRTTALAALVSAGQFSGAIVDTNFSADIIDNTTLIMLHLDNTTFDSNRYKNNGTINGNVACNVTGKINGACDFSGGYINFPKLSIDAQSNYTIAAWIRTTSDGGIFSQSDGTSAHMINLVVSGGSLGLLTFQGGTGNINGNSWISDGNWHHVAATKNGGAGRIYVDGILESTGDVASPSPTNESRIGTGEGGASQFSGMIDEFVVYNRTFSDTEVYDLYVHDPHYTLVQMKQTDSGRFLLAATNGTYLNIEDKLLMVASTKMVSTTFGHFLTSIPSLYPIFIRLEYGDIDINNRLEWSGTGRLLIKNNGMTSRGIPNVTLELTR